MKPCVIGVVFLVALASASSAAAKGCVRINAPSFASVGDPVRVTVRTYSSVMAKGGVVPGDPIWINIPRFKVTAERPDGRQFRFETTTLGEARVARITFGATGAWRVWATNWEYASRSCAAPAVVRVRPHR